MRIRTLLLTGFAVLLAAGCDRFVACVVRQSFLPLQLVSALRQAVERHPLGRGLLLHFVARIDKLARKCNEGELSDMERREYESYVHAIDFSAILQAKARILLSRRDPSA